MRLFDDVRSVVRRTIVNNNQFKGILAAAHELINFLDRIADPLCLIESGDNNGKHRRAVVCNRQSVPPCRGFRCRHKVPYCIIVSLDI